MKWDKKEIEKQMTKVPMNEFLETFQKICDLPDGDEKDDLGQTFFDGMKEANKMCLNMASAEGVITEKEISRWMKHYQVKDDELGELLKAYYFRKMNKIADKDPVVIVTMQDSPTWKMRVLAERRFNLKVVDVDEANKLLKDEEYEKVERLVKECEANRRNQDGNKSSTRD